MKPPAPVINNLRGLCLVKFKSLVRRALGHLNKRAAYSLWSNRLGVRFIC